MNAPQPLTAEELAKWRNVRDRLDPEDAPCDCYECVTRRKALATIDAQQSRITELEEALADWQRAALAGAARICCEECQSECDHDPGFGFDDELYSGAALRGESDA